MNAEHSDVIAGLREACSLAWPPTLKFFDWAEKQRATPKETLVEDIKKALKLSNGEANELAKGIAEAKIGLRIVGRHGSKTRIAWLYSLKSVAHVARGSSAVLEPLESGFTPGESSGHLTHAFRLRPNYEVKLALPRDLTKVEASRLAAFIQTLPFES